VDVSLFSLYLFYRHTVYLFVTPRIPEIGAGYKYWTYITVECLAYLPH
jgi:hypothetical protein